MAIHRNEDHENPSSKVKAAKPKDAASGLQRQLLDLQQKAGNAAVTSTVQRHRLDPDHADES